MTRKNPFVRMSWIDSRPHLMHVDVAALQTELRHLYPTMVMFPRSYHFHELGDEPRRPEFIQDMVEHFLPKIDHEWGYTSGQALAVRVPWPEDIATANPQRLVGRPHRRPFDDSKEAFRRFGRTVYFRPDTTMSRMMLCGIVIQPSAQILAAECKVLAENMPPFRYLGSLGSFQVEMPHDTEDPDVLAFVKSVSSIVNRQTIRTSCLYDGITGEPLVSYSHQPFSKEFSRRCALEPHLYHHISGFYNGHPCFVGPTPAQRWKWRRQAGLVPESKPDPLTIPKFLPHEMHKWNRAHLKEASNDFHIAENKLANRNLYEYVAAGTADLLVPSNPIIPRILPETDIWSEQVRIARESLQRYEEIGVAAYVSHEQLEQRNAALRQRTRRTAKRLRDLK